MLSTIELPSPGCFGLVPSGAVLIEHCDLGTAEALGTVKAAPKVADFTLSSPRCNQSFRAERHHRVDVRRTPGRQVARHESDDRQNGDYANERLRIACGHAEK